nr:MAG: hypothetical protein DIU78_17000 [Pseudomonadota bacterium]
MFVAVFHACSVSDKNDFAFGGDAGAGDAGAGGVNDGGAAGEAVAPPSASGAGGEAGAGGSLSSAGAAGAEDVDGGADSGAGGAAGSGGSAGGGSDACPEDYEETTTGTCRPLLRSLAVLPAAPEADDLVEELDPDFSRARLTYTVQTSFWVTEVWIAAEGASGSRVTVDGTSIEAGEAARVPLELGENVVDIVVASDDESTDYRLTVQRRLPIRLSYPVTGALFGHAVAASGDLLLVGAPGATRVVAYQRTAPGVWENQSEITGPAGFGTSLAYDGETLAVGAPDEPMGGDQYIGAIHLFRQASNGEFQEDQRTVMSVPSAVRLLGTSVAVSGRSAAATTDNYDELHTYTRNASGVWVEDPSSFHTAPPGGVFIEGVVALDGNWLAVGDHNGTTSGPSGVREASVFLYTRRDFGDPWEPPASGTARLTASGMFADSVALRDRTLVVNGEPVRVFERNDDGTWSNRPLPCDSLGPVVVTETALVVGSPQDPYNGVTGDTVRVFRREEPGSTFQEDPSSPLPPQSGAAEGFGFSVAAEGYRVFVGAPNDGNGGAVYVFD